MTTRQVNGAAIRRIREDSGHSLRQLVADVDGLSYSNLSRIENGRVQPSPAMLCRIADALGVELDVISTRVDEDVAS